MFIVKAVLYLLFAVSAFLNRVSSIPTVGSHLSSSDIQQLKQVFHEAIHSDDLQEIYYSTLNIEPTDSKEKLNICQKLLSIHQNSKLSEYKKDFYYIGIKKNLKCSEKTPEELLSKIYASMKSTFSANDEIFYRIAVHKYLGVQLDDVAKGKIVKYLQEILKKEDTLMNLGYGFQIAAELGSVAQFVAERIEDAIVQADEVNGNMLQFEGGLSITALIINGGFKCAKTFDKSPPLTAEQAVKFANYFLSRRSVQTAKGAHVLIEALKTLSTTSGKIAPICIQLVGNGQLHSNNTQLNILILDLLGKPLRSLPKKITGKITNKNDNSILVSDASFVSRSSDKILYNVDISSYKPNRALYTIDITMDEVFQQSLEFKVLGKVKVHHLEIGVAESEASSSIKKQTIVHPRKLAKSLNADHTQKILLKMLLVDESSPTKPINVHQAFIRFVNEQNDIEVIYVMEQDSQKAYKLDMDVGARAVDFKYQSGMYRMFVIVGDASLSNSFEWYLADIDLKLPKNPKPDVKKQPVRSVLPEIRHQFRVPETRPSRIVSDVFTGLCLTPLVLLFVFWSKLGINLSNFDWSPSTIGFHLGFGGILVLFTVFWIKLNMFQTLRILVPLALFTFLCGNRMLRRMYAERVANSNANSTS